MAKPKTKLKTTLRAIPSSRAEDICDTPGCYREKTNRKQGLCSACSSSFYYFRAKKKKDRLAVNRRQKQLAFWQNRMEWLFGAPKK